MATFGRDTTGAEVVEEFNDEVKGKTIVITGTSKGGLGAEITLSLARGSPAHLLLLARSENKVLPVTEQIKGINPEIKATFVPVELDDFESVRKAAATINSNVEKIDIMINNAGTMATKEFTTNKNGIEVQFATNHLGHFLLTSLLFNKIKAAGKGARIVNLTSGGYRVGAVRLEDYNFQNGKEYEPWAAYGQSKTAVLLFTFELAKRLAQYGIQSFAVNPGVIVETSLGGQFDEELFAALAAAFKKNTGQDYIMEEPKTAGQGVSTTLTAALDPRIADKSGSFMEDCAPAPVFDYASSPENARKLWMLSEKLVGEKFDI